jgi:molybdopterin synthase catalytic subunit
MSMSEPDRLHVAMTQQPLDLAALQARMGDPGAGAIVSFLGTVRDHKQGRRVLRIDYEAYEPMALKELHRIGTTLLERWSLQRACLVHRTGRLGVGEASVAIVVAAAHRAPGFEALRYAIEALKKDVPIWKKEHFEDGEVWVQEGS